MHRHACDDRELTAVPRKARGSPRVQFSRSRHEARAYVSRLTSRRAIDVLVRQVTLRHVVAASCDHGTFRRGLECHRGDREDAGEDSGRRDGSSALSRLGNWRSSCVTLSVLWCCCGRPTGPGHSRPPALTRNPDLDALLNETRLARCDGAARLSVAERALGAYIFRDAGCLSFRCVPRLARDAGTLGGIRPASGCRHSWDGAPARTRTFRHPGRRRRDAKRYGDRGDGLRPTNGRYVGRHDRGARGASRSGDGDRALALATALFDVGHSPSSVGVDRPQRCVKPCPPRVSARAPLSPPRPASRSAAPLIRVAHGKCAAPPYKNRMPPATATLLWSVVDASRRIHVSSDSGSRWNQTTRCH